MRKSLDYAVLGAGILACALLVGMVLIVFAAIVLRQFGVLVPGHDEIATYFMVGMACLGLPYAYRRGAHIRVETLLTRLPERWQRRANIWCVLFAAAVCAVFCYFSFGLVWDSFRFGDLSQGLLPVPLWIPQLPIFLGLGLFVLSLIEDFFLLAQGKKGSFEVSAPTDAVSQAE